MATACKPRPFLAVVTQNGPDFHVEPAGQTYTPPGPESSSSRRRAPYSILPGTSEEAKQNRNYLLQTKDHIGMTAKKTPQAGVEAVPDDDPARQPSAEGSSKSATESEVRPAAKVHWDMKNIESAKPLLIANGFPFDPRENYIEGRVHDNSVVDQRRAREASRS